MNTIMPTKIAGIPCQIRITHFYRKHGEYSFNSNSDADYYGYTECDFNVLDRKGYDAPWLHKKMTIVDEQRIADEIEEFLCDPGH